ncbi:hypothetical protein WJX75_004729 [Coccomyxa subellipsoidea]|uniref:Uncharacterized protein n=1 Tax=Coccomyxa subellipsoidea TaxID=248742 RepID=A0ABR2YI61_9CHLO
MRSNTSAVSGLGGESAASHTYKATATNRAAAAQPHQFPLLQMWPRLCNLHRLCRQRRLLLPQHPVMMWHLTTIHHTPVSSR